MENKEFISTRELAKILGISRVAVFRKIKSGKIKAKKIGRNFVISKKDLPAVLGNVVSEKQKNDINQAVKKAVHQYGETFRLLGQE
jgi:excisionase family DNA binding protein